MAGAAAAESILFIGATLAATVVAVALGGIAVDFTDSVESRAEALQDEMTGRIRVVNDPVNVDITPLTLYVKNTGGRELRLADFAVLVDGTASDDFDVTVDGGAAELLAPGELAVFEVNDATLLAGDHKVVVIADSGFSDDLAFTV